MLNTLTVVVLVGFMILMLLDFSQSREATKKIQQSYIINIKLFLFNCILLSSISGLIVISSPDIAFGLLTNITNPTLKIVLSFLILDLFLYYWHKLCHTYDWLWMFHRVHHNETHLTTSTAFRLHFLEIFFTNTIKAGVIVVMGIDQAIALIDEAITTLFVMFHHSSIITKSEKWLNKLIVTPLVHRVHHSTERIEHDSNYGAILTIWDRMFGTYITPKSCIVGIKGDSPQDFVGLIKFGMTPCTPTTPIYTPQFNVSIDEMIATAAYYKAEKRGFQHGNDQHDWFEAQQEINRIINQQCTV